MHTDTQRSHEKLSDEVLIARVARGDATSLETLYDRYAALIMGISLKITGNRPEAERVLQETFWQVWQSAATYQRQLGTFTSWLFKITRQLAIEQRWSNLNKK